MTDRLDAQAITAGLSEHSQKQIVGLKLFNETASTNDWLMEQAAPAAGCFDIAVAEQQTAGRGQRGRRWQSPAGSGLYFSLAYTFKQNPERLSALTLSIGVGVVQAMSAVHVTGLKLKWPNDIIASDRKLGGILTEARATSEAASVVIGVGLNVDLSNVDDVPESRIGLATDLKQHCDACLPCRNTLLSVLLDTLIENVLQFDQSGFMPVYKVWPKYDWLQNQPVSIEQATEQSCDVVLGVCQGIDKDGALLIERGGNLHRLVSGTVTRLVQDSVA